MLNLPNSELKVKFLKGKNFELLEDFSFYFDKDLSTLYPNVLWHSSRDIGTLPFISIPQGFKTDFGSIPAIFRSFVNPIGSATKAFVLHDFLCEKAREAVISRKECDRIFKEALIMQGIGRLKRMLIYRSVRFYAFIKGLK